jgi:hypothetical protein
VRFGTYASCHEQTCRHSITLSAWASSRSNSNTSSARAIELGGTSRPTGLAAFKLIANSNLVGCTTSRSGGSSTERIRSAYFPICRYASIRMGKRIGEAAGGLERCELRDRDLPQVISSTLKASIGPCKPLTVSSPTGSAVALPSRAARTLPSIKIWPSRASAQRRAARLTTVPIAL